MLFKLILNNIKAINQQQNTILRRTMRITPIPANQDNYMYLIMDEQTRIAAIVDPVDLKKIFKEVNANDLKLKSAFVTHHHWDHAGGTDALKKAQNDIEICGGDATRIEAIDSVLKDGQKFELGSLKVTALATPCHTNAHICYYVEDEASKQRAIFTGDTLFVGGCGRFFEGDATQMHTALNEKIAKLPGDTLVYCGHEYTVKNLQFALSVEPQNENVKKKMLWAKTQRKAGHYTIPSTIAEEKMHNPFMRVGIPEIQKKLGTDDEIATMQKLRDMKDKF